MSINLQAIADMFTLPLGSFNLMATVEAFLNNPMFIFILGLVLLGLFIWYLGTEKDSVKRNAGTFFVIGIAAFSMFSILTKGLKYGIDIAGGVSFTLQVEPNKDEFGKNIPLSPEAMEQACLILGQRLNSSGANDVIIRPKQKEDMDLVEVQIPAADPAKREETINVLTRVAKLQLLEVHPNSAQLVAEGRRNVPGWRLYEYKGLRDDNSTFTEKLFLSKRENLSGKDVMRAHVDLTKPGYVNVVLTNEGSDKMFAMTSKMRLGQDRLAVVLDDEVKCAPRVDDALNKSFSISGLNGKGEAEAISKVLGNPLTNKLELISMSEVSASLGKTALRQGEYAGIAGLIICFVLMMLYYRFAGLVAIVGLTINALLLLGAMSVFGFELTLPGIAGIVLTLGVAVDANVLIYERLREEKDSGRPFRIALRNSFDKAFSAIFDSNITSLITAVILYWMSTGTIRGFAVTLTVGIVTSMIGALVVTRVLFYWADASGMMKDLKFLNLFKTQSKVNFMGKRVYAAIFSSLVLIICLATTVVKGKSCLGMDFTGGSSISYRIDQDAVDFKKVETTIASLNLSQKPQIQEISESTDSSKLNLSISFADNANDRSLILSTIAKKFPQLESAPFSEENIGQSMGYETLIASAWALLAGLIGIMIYLTVRFEWTFALGSVIALAHDVLIVFGLIIISGTELGVIHIGALLTVAGYSINDKIIVFDRIRETIRYASPDEKPIDMMNEAINSTLSRTLLTSVSTLAVLVCLFFFGGPAMRDFSWTICAGILIGTYSSIMISPAAALFFSRKEGLIGNTEEV